jgi:hypothetical protein
MEDDHAIAKPMLLGEERATRQLDVSGMSTDGENRSLATRVPRESRGERKGYDEP